MPDTSDGTPAGTHDLVDVFSGRVEPTSDTVAMDAMRGIIERNTSRPEPCPLWGHDEWPENHEDDCPECGALVAWESEAWDRIAASARVFVARSLELWPNLDPASDLDPAIELRSAYLYLARNPGDWPSDRPRRRPINGATRIQVLERDAYRCVKCGSWEDLTVDHIVPVIHGGAHHMDNFQTLCGSCNGSKGART